LDGSEAARRFGFAPRRSSRESVRLSAPRLSSTGICLVAPPYSRSRGPVRSRVFFGLRAPFFCARQLVLARARFVLLIALISLLARGGARLTAETKWGTK